MFWPGTDCPSARTSGRASQKGPGPPAPAVLSRTARDSGARLQAWGWGVCQCPLLLNPERGPGGGVVTFLFAEWPWGRGWVVMAMEIQFGGDSVPSHPQHSAPCLLVLGRAQLVPAFLGGGAGPLSPEATGQAGEVPRSLKTPGLEPDAPQIGAQRPTPSPGCISAHVRPPSFHAPRAPSQAFCLCLGALISALACPYLLLGPQSTWPPGLCPAGSQAVGSAASAAGSCSLPSAGPGPPGPDLRGWLGGCLAVSLSSDLCTFSTRALSPQTVEQGPSPRSSRRPGPHRLALSFWANRFSFLGLSFSSVK